MGAILNFPTSPTNGQLYPNPAVPGQMQFIWNGTTWLGVASTTDFVRKSGDNMGGILALYGPDPQSDYEAAHKKYVDAKVATVDLSGKVSKSGDTMSGSLTIKPASNAILALDKAAGGASISSLVGRTNGKMRWELQVGDGNAESGANAGSGLGVYRYDDSGALLGFALLITRATGNASFVGDLGVGRNLIVNGNSSTVSLSVSGNATVTGSFGVTGAMSTQARLDAAGGLVATGILNAVPGYVGFLVALTNPILTNNTGDNIASSTYSRALQVPASSGQSYITFHNVGAFAANFGMDGAGNFYCGGVSFGATVYKFWTTRDFASLPNLAPYVTNARLAYAGDLNTSNVGMNIQEP